MSSKFILIKEIYYVLQNKIIIFIYLNFEFICRYVTLKMLMRNSCFVKLVIYSFFNGKFENINVESQTIVEYEELKLFQLKWSIAIAQCTMFQWTQIYFTIRLFWGLTVRLFQVLHSPTALRTIWLKMKIKSITAF